MGLNLKSIGGALKTGGTIAKNGLSGRVGTAVGQKTSAKLLESEFSEKSANIIGKIAEKGTNAVFGATAGAAGGAVVGGGISLLDEDTSFGQGMAKGAKIGATAGAIGGGIGIGMDKETFKNGISALTEAKDRAMAEGVATFKVGQQKIGEAAEDVAAAMNRRYTVL